MHDTNAMQTRRHWEPRTRIRDGARYWGALTLVLAGLWWLLARLDGSGPGFHLGAPITLVVVGLFLLVPRPHQAKPHNQP